MSGQTKIWCKDTGKTLADCDCPRHRKSSELASPSGSETLPARVLAMCKSRRWSLHWTARGAYLHLEASELIEALRGKGGEPTAEAADVLLVLMSITEANGIRWGNVLEQLKAKLEQLESVPEYNGEERSPNEKDERR